MGRLASASRIAFSCTLVAGAVWVAMPLATFLLHGPPPVDRPGEAAGKATVTSPSPPPRRVIGEVFAASEDLETFPEPALDAEGAPDPVFPEDDGRSTSPPLAPSAAPLPAVPAAMAFRPPPLDPGYRSTVEIPPPPLLDAANPPPLSVSVGSRPPLPPQHAAGTWQDRYAVRDGDDLTAIAIRFYGSPAAADSIWLANRDRLDDPRVLPIGLELRLPHPVSAGVPAGGRKRTIEPL